MTQPNQSAVRTRSRLANQERVFCHVMSTWVFLHLPCQVSCTTWVALSASVFTFPVLLHYFTSAEPKPYLNFTFSLPLFTFVLPVFLTYKSTESAGHTLFSFTITKQGGVPPHFHEIDPKYFLNQIPSASATLKVFVDVGQKCTQPHPLSPSLIIVIIY